MCHLEPLHGHTWSQIKHESSTRVHISFPQTSLHPCDCYLDHHPHCGVHHLLVYSKVRLRYMPRRKSSSYGTTGFLPDINAFTPKLRMRKPPKKKKVVRAYTQITDLSEADNPFCHSREEEAILFSPGPPIRCVPDPGHGWWQVKQQAKCGASRCLGRCNPNGKRPIPQIVI